MEIVGENVLLRTMSIDDRDALIAIRRTPEVMAWWRGNDLEAEFARDLEDDELVHLTILDNERKVVGLIQFYEEMDPDYRHASIDIYIAPDHHRKGIATRAITAVASHLFNADHHRLTIDPSVDNAHAIACYGKIGFQPVGVMRQYERRGDGTWGDGMLMELLRSDWRSATSNLVAS